MPSHATNADPCLAQPLTAAVLAGGKNLRMDGRKKALLTVGSESILSRTLDVLAPVADPVILIANEPLCFAGYNLSILSDVYPGCGALGGLYTALFYARTPYVLVAACDMPFLSRALVRKLLSFRGPRVDAVVPRTSLGFEPLCALYSRSCLGPVGNSLRAGKLKVTSFFSQVNLTQISEDVLRETEPSLASFVNVNTPEDLAEARKRAEPGKPAGNEA
ncbi:MAG: molybdenum cofactor guanylyltransferase [Thermodesulfobacteriota bacterium]